MFKLGVNGELACEEVYRRIVIIFILRELCYLFNIFLFLIFVMKKVICNSSKEKKILLIVVIKLIILLFKFIVDIVGLE